MIQFLFKLSIPTMLMCTLCTSIKAQFTLNGTAIEINDSCFQLTSAVNWEVGSIWNGEKVNLDESFEVAVELFLGCKDLEGADGMVFGLQPVSTTAGTGGGDLGFAGIVPSLGVEFDTHHNPDYDDPQFDHITIVRDGNVRHNTPEGALAGPVQASATTANIEDCEYHSVKISWDADMQTLSVFFECELRLSYTGDIVNEIFNGDPEVFWGFTAATGGLNNVHEICFTYTSFLDAMADQVICPGTDIQLGASGGVSYQWSPPEGLSDPNIANPIASPEETTLYTVEILDDCGIPFIEDVLIIVDDNQFEVEMVSSPSNLNEIEIPLGTEVTFSVNVTPPDEGNYTYLWSSAIGSTFSPPDSSSTTVTSSRNQIGTETITVQVISEEGCLVESSISFGIKGTLYAIPNVFTPNGDATNDAFGVVTNSGVEIEEYNCKIFNRWGQMVFESSDHEQYWDGTFEDEPAASDVYVYLINMDIGSVRFEEKGDLTLLR